MNKPIRRPQATELRRMATTAVDPAVRDALLDLAAEYERSAAKA